MKVRYALLFFFTIITAQTVLADNSDLLLHINLNQAGLAIQGYDPVSYHTGKPTRGKQEYSFVRDGATYHFLNLDNLETFKYNPVAYLPAFGGWCAWAMLDGQKVDVDPETFKIINGITYLFYNSFITNTLSKWNKRAERDTEVFLIRKARSEWTKLNIEG